MTALFISSATVGKRCLGHKSTIRPMLVPDGERDTEGGVEVVAERGPYLVSHIAHPVELRREVGQHDGFLHKGRSLPVVVEAIAEHGSQSAIAQLALTVVEKRKVSSDGKREMRRDRIGVHQG